LLSRIAKVSGEFEMIRGIAINKIPNPECEETNLELLRILRDSIDSCEELIEEYLEGCSHIQTINDRFQRSFE